MKRSIILLSLLAGCDDFNRLEYCQSSGAANTWHARGDVVSVKIANTPAMVVDRKYLVARDPPADHPDMCRLKYQIRLDGRQTKNGWLGAAKVEALPMVWVKDFEIDAQ